MLLLLLVALGALILQTGSASASPDPTPCRAMLPHGPSVPEPIVLRTTCGGFRLAGDGTVTRLPPGWFAARAGETGRRYGADLRIQRNRPGRITLLQGGRVVWRSSQLYRNDGGSVAFGPRAFAFAAYRRGVFITDLTGPERLIMRGVGLFPVAFLADGTLLVSKTGQIALVSPDGSVLRRYRYRRKNGFAFDQTAEALFFVTPGRLLVRADGTAVRALRPLGDLDGWVGFAGRHLTLSDDESLAVVRRDGSISSSWSWRIPTGSRLDLSPVASEDGRTGAFRTVRSDGRGSVVLYVLRERRKRATAIFQHRGVQVGCGVGASFEWHGDWLLYSATDGPTALVDVQTGRVRSLARLAAQLPRRSPGERTHAHWASSFPASSG